MDEGATDPCFLPSSADEEKQHLVDAERRSGVGLVVAVGLPILAQGQRAGCYHMDDHREKNEGMNCHC